MESENVPECSGCENYCINCGKAIPFIGNPFTPGMWVCEECQAAVHEAAADLSE
jgi:RNA polymerase-binding transcription factor DksA